MVLADLALALEVLDRHDQLEELVVGGRALHALDQLVDHLAAGGQRRTQLGGELLRLAAAKNGLPNASPGGVPNTEAIGRVLYTDYIFFFQLAGLVLLVAMIGAIVLTLRHKPGVKRQDIGKQVARTPKTGMTLVQIKPGEGISE